MERAHAGIGIAVSLGLCLVLPGCSDGEEERKADCAKISSALSATADPSAEQVLEALREVRPGLEDDEIAEHVDTVIASGAKDLASDGKAEMSDDEALRFAEAAERIRDACGLSG
ncbi:hypothetical protein [Actinomadura livida]|uniref:Citrate lyase beta subunit n=1 Tax=Actinomadura livida TaxID=79909 RepID=A0A7W7N1N0_9ACTN|nr:MULTISPECIES: hypothetical protein [Actinomadura]MBB4778132.1 citrate lyase beta subunit [Actinomadura catellatispora]GGU29036.1 hypothetical protein GCM10010208_62220 [Actinomadura livida]